MKIKMGNFLVAMVMMLPLAVLAQENADQVWAPENISALGRLEPENGIIRVAAPAMAGITSGPAVRELFVDEGDDVEAGQLLARTDLSDLMMSILAEQEAALELVRVEAEAAMRRSERDCALVDTRLEEARRRAELRESKVSSLEEYEQARALAISTEAACIAGRADAEAAKSAILVAEAGLKRAEAELARTEIRAPSNGRVLEILSFPGEIVRNGAVLEMGNVERMYAIAEVYETDVSRIEVGQTARVMSPAFDQALTGVVEHIRLKVQKQDEIGTDPAARKDARIVEVEVLLDDSAQVEGLSNLQVTVEIGS